MRVKNYQKDDAAMRPFQLDLLFEHAYGPEKRPDSRSEFDSHGGVNNRFVNVAVNGSGGRNETPMKK